MVDRVDRLLSSSTLVEGMEAIKFGSVTESRKRELEEQIRVT